MTHCYPRPPMRWNGAIGVIARCKRVSTVCVPKSRSKQELRSICGEKPKAKGVSRPFKPYMKRVQDDSNPVPLLQSRISSPFPTRSHAQRRSSSMRVLSYAHQLFNAEQCQASIHTLRWKDRPLQCPRCQSPDIDPWGTYHYRPGCKRYWCNGCKRTFNDLAKTLLHQSKRSLPYWILATFLLCLACSSRRIAREVGVHIRTSYRWCWWLRNAALSYEMDRQLAGTVEADDLYHTAGNKGQAKGGGKKSLGRRARSRRKKREPGRGHYDKDRPAIIAWVSRQGAVVLQATKDFTVKTVQKAANIAQRTGSRLYTDSASSYRAVTGYVHEYVKYLSKSNLIF